MYEEISKGFDMINCSFYVNRGNKISKNGFTKDIRSDMNDFDKEEYHKLVRKKY